MNKNKVVIPKIDEETLNLVVAVYNKVCRPGVPLENGPQNHFNVDELTKGLDKQSFLEYRIGSYITGHSKIWFGQSYEEPGITVWVTANNDKYGRKEKSMEKKFSDLLTKRLKESRK